jgi:TerC family integral membrane protein
MVETSVHVWLIFGAAILFAIAVDLGVFHRQPKAMTLRSALVETGAWIGLALAFNLWVYFSRGHQTGLDFFTAYVVEKSLSLDNIFVFMLIFQALRVPAQSQHKVLYFGVIGALVMRAGFVIAGVELLRNFHAILYLFGAILLLTGVRLLLPGKRVMQVELKWPFRLVRRALPVTAEFHGEKFWIRSRRGWNATPLLVALVVVEVMDIVFAIDSVPAVLAITRDSFIAYSSNVFAVLGLRAMYFGMADILPRFRFLHPGLAAILIFVGAKMLIDERMPIPTETSLGIIAAIIVVMIGASVLCPRVEQDSGKT